MNLADGWYNTTFTLARCLHRSGFTGRGVYTESSEVFTPRAARYRDGSVPACGGVKSEQVLGPSKVFPPTGGLDLRDPVNLSCAVVAQW